MGHKHLLVTQLYRLLRGALKQEHAKRLPQGFVQVGIAPLIGAARATWMGNAHSAEVDARTPRRSGAGRRALR
jgi:hypothetical protein